MDDKQSGTRQLPDSHISRVRDSRGPARQLQRNPAWLRSPYRDAIDKFVPGTGMRADGLLRYLFCCGVFGREVAEMKMVGETGGPGAGVAPAGLGMTQRGNPARSAAVNAWAAENPPPVKLSAAASMGESLPGPPVIEFLEGVAT